MSIIFIFIVSIQISVMSIQISIIFCLLGFGKKDPNIAVEHPGLCKQYFRPIVIFFLFRWRSLKVSIHFSYSPLRRKLDVLKLGVLPHLRCISTKEICIPTRASVVSNALQKYCLLGSKVPARLNSYIPPSTTHVPSIESAPSTSASQVKVSLRLYFRK